MNPCPVFKILCINPGSTSTKYAYFENTTCLSSEDINHSHESLLSFNRIADQFAMRKKAILDDIQKKGCCRLDQLDAVVGRGGLLKPIAAGTYRVEEKLLTDLRSGTLEDHASNLGGLIAADIAAPFGLPAFIVDPPVVNEADDISLITGVKEIRRRVISHALSQRSAAKRYAEEVGKPYETLNLIVAHLGGGISIGAHRQGRYADVNNALDGEGPMSPERSGTLPAGQLIDLCFSGKYTHQEFKRLNRGKGGLLSLLGTSDFREVEKRVLDGDPEAIRITEAMAYQIAKSISALLPAFHGQPADRIIITGGLSRSPILMNPIRRFLAAFPSGMTLYPDTSEMQALASAAWRVLSGHDKAKKYA